MAKENKQSNITSKLSANLPFFRKCMCTRRRCKRWYIQYQVPLPTISCCGPPPLPPTATSARACSGALPDRYHIFRNTVVAALENKIDFTHKNFCQRVRPNFSWSNVYRRAFAAPSVVLSVTKSARISSTQTVFKVSLPNPNFATLYRNEIFEH